MGRLTKLRACLIQGGAERLQHIPKLFTGFDPLPDIEHITVFGMLKNKTRDKVGGGDVLTVCELLNEIRSQIPSDYAAQTVPEQFVILRALQFAAQCWET